MADTPKRRAIPGFVFDEARGRYFPILPGHKAPPNYNYTVDAVKKQDELQGKQKIDEAKASCTSFRSQHHERYLDNPGLGRFMLETGWGTPRDRMEMFTREFASSLEVGETLQPEGVYKIQKFHRDHETGAIIVGAHGMFNIGLCSTSLGGRDGAVINLSKLVSKESYAVDGLLQSDCQVTLCPGNRQSIWTSAVSKSDGTAAAGTSNSVIIIKEAQCHWADQALEIPTDVFALEFLRPELLACGSRDRALRLIDTRIPITHDGSFILHHPSTILHIKQINENNVIACGLEDSLCMYDLRWGHPKSPSKGFKKPSQSMLEFVDHKNKFRLGLGFDVDVECGIVAAATDDNYVQLFSLNTAEIIRSPVFNEPLAGVARCIQFTGIHDGGGRSRSLLVSVDNTIREFSW